MVDIVAFDFTKMAKIALVLLSLKRNQFDRWLPLHKSQTEG